MRRRRPYRRRRPRRGRVPRAIRTTGYLATKQKTEFDVNVLSGLLNGTPYALNFKGEDIPQWTTFQRLFDSYRLRGVKIVGVPMTNAYSTANPGYRLLSCIDLDDDTLPASADELLQRSNCKVQQCTPQMTGYSQMFKRYVKPRFLTQLFETNVSTGYGLGRRSQWLDCTDGAIPHFGLKMYFDTSAAALNLAITWRFTMTYYLDFKSLR